MPAAEHPIRLYSARVRPVNSRRAETPKVGSSLDSMTIKSRDRELRKFTRQSGYLATLAIVGRPCLQERKMECGQQIPGFDGSAVSPLLEYYKAVEGCLRCTLTRQSLGETTLGPPSATYLPTDSLGHIHAGSCLSAIHSTRIVLLIVNCEL